MSKDFAFMFMPGDYLRDTQCLSEKSQVAYDRIMCEHMRNICISQAQLNFFTKRLSEDEKSELLLVLSKETDGFFIEWVRESISKRKCYSESRRKNREGKPKEEEPIICKSHDSHMENENEYINEIDNNNQEGIQGGKPEKKKKFTNIPPSIKEIDDRLIERKITSFSAEKFHAFYTSKGWKIGKNPMKNWDAAITTWSSRNDNQPFSNPMRRPSKVEGVAAVAQEVIDEIRNGIHG
jgi:hypothetical protein